MTDFLVVYITVESTEEGDRLARALVEEKLAACVNRIGGVRSTYAWKGEIETEEEQLLIVKTSAAAFDQLEHRVRELHSYEVPEIIAVPVVRGNRAYLKWMAEALV
jgi:uncharacterized protein involved in tolerance to divalent cations